ncbi:tRNA-specific adenosine deaminase, partial [Streptomyces sp. SID1328]|nr:tRNA-specific adenosine deaminase [Streptomyces sp. SID1328]
MRDPWRAAMRLALAEAGRAALGGDVPVGAVVLGPDGTTVLGAGHNEREAAGDPTAHAEVL